MTKWSATADFLSLVLGVPVSLAGSIVAIYIAHRAFVVSEKQSDLESRMYIDQSSEKVAETYWQITNSIRDLDITLDDFAFKTFLLEMLKDTSKGSGERVSNLRDEVKAIANIFENQINDLSVKILLILRDPISLEDWRQKSEYWDTISTSNALQHEKEFVPPEIQSLLDNLDPSTVSQEIRRYISKKNLSEVTDLTSIFRKSMLRTFVKEMKSDDGGHTYRFLTDDNQPDRSRTAKEWMSNTMHLYDVKKQLQNPEARLLIIGSLIGVSNFKTSDQQFKQRWGGDGSAIINVGALLILHFVTSYPTTQTLSNSMNSFMDRSYNLSKHERYQSLTNLTSKNIDSYLPLWLSQAAKAISLDSSMLLTPISTEHLDKIQNDMLMAGLDSLKERKEVYKNLD